VSRERGLGFHESIPAREADFLGQGIRVVPWRVGGILFSQHLVGLEGEILAHGFLRGQMDIENAASLETTETENAV